MSRRILLFTFVLATVPALAGAPATSLFLPIAGRAVGGDGRQYFTTIRISNPSAASTAVTLTFLPAGERAVAPPPRRFKLQAAGSLALDVDRRIMGRDAGTGGVRIDSDSAVTAVARTYSRAAGAVSGSEIGGSFEAVPADQAIGTAETTTVPGVSLREGRYKLYLLETTGQPLHFDIALLDQSGRAVAAHRSFLAPNEARALDVGNEMRLPPDAQGVLRVTGANGSGKLVAAGELVSASGDGSPFTMTFAKSPRHRLTRAELILYCGVLVLVLAAIVRRR